MIDVIGVRFKKASKIYYFDPQQIPLEVGDGVIVETSKGVEYGEVVIGRRQVEDGEVVKPLKSIMRKATPRDREKLEENHQKEKRAFAICREKIEKHKLDMKLISVEYTFDGSKILFSFTAEGRVDFRELVKDLASVFKTRIELRQIGVRDETKMIGGLGPCGRPACCSVFLGDFQPVSIKMAKEQNLSLSPTKISGLCGRLMCCLNYEQAYYEELRTILPRVGAEVKTADGVGIVMDTNAVRQLVKVKVETADGEAELHEYPVGDITVLRKAARRPRPNAEKQGEAEPDAPEEENPQSPRREAREGEPGGKQGGSGGRNRPRGGKSRGGRCRNRAEQGEAANAEGQRSSQPRPDGKRGEARNGEPREPREGEPGGKQARNGGRNRLRGGEGRGKSRGGRGRNRAEQGEIESPEGQRPNRPRQENRRGEPRNSGEARNKELNAKQAETGNRAEQPSSGGQAE